MTVFGGRSCVGGLPMNEVNHKIALDAHLFIIGDEGVVFLEEAQRLYALNTAATFLWCSLQEGKSLSETTVRMAQSSSASRDRVEQLIQEMIGSWEEVGLIEGSRKATPTPLRRSLDPNISPQIPQTLVPVTAAISECRYRILDSYIRVTFNSIDAATRVHACFGHLKSEEASRDDVTFEVIEVEEGFWIKQDDAVECFCHSIRQLVPALKGLLSACALNNTDHLMILHAAVVGDRSSCIILPGASGSGKSTLSAAMMQAGYEFLSDEFALLQETTLNVRSVPLALCLKSTGWPLLTNRFPDLNNLPSHKRFDDKIVRYLQPSDPSGDGNLDRERPVKAIVFPLFKPGVKTVIRPLSPIETLGRLLDQCLVIPKWLDRTTVARLVNWVQHLDCWELQMSSLGEAIEFVGECFEGPVERRAQNGHDQKGQSEACAEGPGY